MDGRAPSIAAIAPNVAMLWPPNHRMVPITLAVDATDDVSSATCSISGVVSNEPDNGLGDGDTANDIQAIAGLTVQLRSERSGKSNGRIYSITVRCVDAAGNATTAQTTVTVPKNQSTR